MQMIRLASTHFRRLWHRVINRNSDVWPSDMIVMRNSLREHWYLQDILLASLRLDKRFVISFERIPGREAINGPPLDKTAYLPTNTIAPISWLTMGYGSLAMI